jgi:hypothetical protein
MGKLFPEVSGQVVMLFAPPGRDFVAKLLNFCSCSQDKFVMVAAPGHAHLPARKIRYTLTVFWLRSALYRYTAPVSGTNFVTGAKFAASINFVPRHCASALNQICNRTSKSAPPRSLRYCGSGSPSLHRDSFLAKEPG